MFDFMRTWSVVMTGQAPHGVDIVLMWMFTIAAITQYTAIANVGCGYMRWRPIVAFGWSLWAVRFWWAWLVDDDPVVPPVAAVAVFCIALGAVLRNFHDSGCRHRYKYET